MKKLLTLFTFLLFISCNNDDNYYVDYSKSIEILSNRTSINYGFNSADIYIEVKNNSNKNLKVQFEYYVVNFLNVRIGEYKTEEIDVYSNSIKTIHQYVNLFHQNKNIEVKGITYKILAYY